MTISNVASNLRPGICTSTTRPTTPYEGQVIYETDTDLTYIWNGSAWYQISGSTAVGNSGLVYVASGSFTNVGSFDVTGFSSTYDFYQLMMLIGGASATAGLTAQLYSGSTVRNSTYYGQQFLSTYTGGTGVYNTRANAANFAFPDATVTPKTLINSVISGIGDGQFNITHHSMDNANVGAWFGGYSNYAATNSFDKIRVTGNVNISGAWQLMGVRKP